jgi:hypothetical protein
MITFALYFTIGKTGDGVILKMPSQIWLLPSLILGLVFWECPSLSVCLLLEIL